MSSLLRGNVGRSNLSRYMCGRSFIWRLSDSTTLNTAFVYHLKQYHKFQTSLCGRKRGASLGMLTGKSHPLFLYSLHPLLKQVKENGGFYRLFHASPQRISQENPSSNNKQNDPNLGSEDGNPGPSWNELFPLAIIMLALTLSLAMKSTPETTWNEFYKEMLSKGEVKLVEVDGTVNKVYVYLHRGAQVRGVQVSTHGPHFVFGISSVDSFENKMNQAQKELKIKPSDFIPIQYYEKGIPILYYILFLATIIVGYLSLFNRRAPRGDSKGGIFGNPFSRYIKAKATVVMPGTGNGVTFKDVAGMNEAKQEVMEFVDYLKSSDRYSQLGAKIPKGALLVGPPGTGKTLLAKAVATEADVPFLSMAGSDFVEMFVGVGSARVRDLFARARKLSPCIVYIDEVDAIGRSRQSYNSMGGGSESENTLNQLLVEMDGMNTVEGVVMLASTNRADILDQALLRPGRFDRLIAIDLPTLPERQAIFEVHLKGLTLGNPIKHYSKRLAELTPGHSGADIANICNEAALHAARLNEKTVDIRNFEYAVERVIAGMEKRNSAMSPEERRTQAFHEAGHAVVGWMLEHTDPLLKVSIVPRTNSARGFTLYLPSDQKLYTTEQLFDRMCLALGGRAAEAKIFRKVTTGAEDDLKKATDMAYKQIVTFGMNDRVGNISFPVKKSSELSKRPYSDKLAAIIDEEVRLLLGRAYLTTQDILNKNHDKLLKLAEELLNKEVLNYDDIAEIIGKCPYGDKRRKSDWKALSDALSTEQLPNL